MSDNNTETNGSPNPFDFSSFPPNTLFHERRNGRDRRDKAAGTASVSLTPNLQSDRPAPPERRVRKERRKRIDPTTFEKQYTEEEMEFMTAMQRYKEQSGKAFPTHGEVLMVAAALGYRRVVIDPIDDLAGAEGGLLEIN